MVAGTILGYTPQCRPFSKHKRRPDIVKIKQILQTKRSISCEFFPPKSAEGIPGVFRAIDRLKAFNPDFVSVTYGAGG